MVESAAAIMSAWGLLGASVAKGRFGGVVGKVVLMFGGVGTAAAIAAYSVGSTVPGAITIVTIVALAALVVGGVLVFAHLHPAEALLDGADWLKHQATIQAKGSPPTLPSGPTSYPLMTADGEKILTADGIEIHARADNG